MTIICLAVGILGLTFGGLCGYRLWHWERQLRGARIAIAYKGRIKMDAPLIDWLTWINLLDKDERTTGRAVYKMNATTVAILKRRPPNKAKTSTRKEGQDGKRRPLHRMAQRRRATSTPTSSGT